MPIPVKRELAERVSRRVRRHFQRISRICPLAVCVPHLLPQGRIGWTTLPTLRPAAERGVSGRIESRCSSSVNPHDEVEVSMTGKIRTLRVDKGFGFIKDENGNEYFFHQSAIYGEGINDLREGDSVEFEIRQDRRGRGPRTFDVRRHSALCRRHSGVPATNGCPLFNQAGSIRPQRRGLVERRRQ